MRLDYELFNSMLKQLRGRDLDLFMLYLNQELDYNGVSEKYNIVYNSAIRKVMRIKLIVRQSFLDIKGIGFMVSGSEAV